MRTEHVIVVPYNQKWTEEFEKIKKEIMSSIGKYIVRIEHVGSTSVEGLWAKPIIDIDAVIPDYKCLDEVIKELESIGYEYEGNLGIKGREAFKYKNKPHLMLHHLYICPSNSPELRRHITVRDYLRNHEDDVKEYSRVKREGASLYPDDIDSYCEHKSSCINNIYGKCGLL